MRRCIALCCTATLAVAAPRAPAHDPPAVLPGTQPLVMGQPLDEVMVEGISRYALRALAESPGVRDAARRIEGGSPARYAQLAEHRRERFRAIIGAVDPRLPAGGFEVVTKLGGDGLIARSASVDVYAVRWPVFAGVHGEGLLLRPRKPPAARVVAIPDAAWTPELFAAVANAPDGPRPIAALLAEAGAEVVVPVLVSREDDCSGSPLVGYTNLPHREFIYRQAFPMGRHIVGYEVAKVQAALDQFERLNQSQGRSLPMGAVGVGEGGMLAYYAAAIDPRMESVLVSGYFEARGSIWKEPIYRNVWGLLTEFGDAELAALAAPRRLVVEACAVPEVAGPPPLRAGRRGCAAPGAVITCALANVQSEFDRAKAMYQRQEPAERLSLVVSGDGRGPSGSDAALVAFLDGLGIRLDASPAVPRFEATADPPDAALRQRRQVQELTDYTQRLMRLSEKVREDFWAKADRSSTQRWRESTEFYRNHVWEEMIGKLPEPALPLNVRTRRVIAEPHCAGYEVVIDVLPEVVAGGVLLLPTDLRAGEKRPLIICQHGLEGVAGDVSTRSGEAYGYYKAFADELVRRGFIVYAPQNPYRGGDRFRLIQRQANPLKLSLFSFIIRQHERTLIWLQSLPSVDASRIAFYGLSYGGKTAMRVPPILRDRYAACICSADFNDWVRKMASVDDAYSYVFTPEYEMPEWNLGHVASYAELASLFTPRPFMIERGHDDGVAPDEWVAAEFAKVRRHYGKLGLGDRVAADFFDGPHTIHGEATFDFLHKHLDWPAKR